MGRDLDDLFQARDVGSGVRGEHIYETRLSGRFENARLVPLVKLSLNFLFRNSRGAKFLAIKSGLHCSGGPLRVVAMRLRGYILKLRIIIHGLEVLALDQTAEPIRTRPRLDVSLRSQNVYRRV